MSRGQPLVWLKTEHAYPSRAALAAKPAGTKLGEYLITQGKVTEADVYEALSLQQNVPFGKPRPDVISRPVTRSLPAENCQALARAAV